MNKNSKIFQAGQTLIETMVAALVLVMGITAAVTLALYGLGTSEDISKQLIATGLAREGMEAVKNIRDSNWLSTLRSDNCFDFYITTGNTDSATCYPEWLTGISGPSYVLEFDTNELDTTNFWNLTTSTDYRLRRNLNDSQLTKGFYNTNQDTDAPEVFSDYSRKITLTEENFAPFDHPADLGPRLKVHVDVWWVSDRCPLSINVPPSITCKISLETYLTNWKNY